MSDPKELPISFCAPMICAINENRKSQTRRVKNLEKIYEKHGPCALVEQPRGDIDFSSHWPRFRYPKWHAVFVPKDTARSPFAVPCPYGQPGDRLWVREAHYLTDDGDNEYAVYAADEEDMARHINTVGNIASRLGLGDEWLKRHTKLRPAIFMPRWASRITLEITDIRVERLNEITPEDAKAEGDIERSGFPEFHQHGPMCHVHWYRDLWDQINGSGSWDANPWVWVISFRRLEQAKEAA